MKIVVERPCCWSRRTCHSTRVIIYNTLTSTVDKEVYPYRCHLYDHDLTAEIEFDPAVHLVFYFYRTFRNNAKLAFYNIPPTMTLKQAVEIIREKWQVNEVLYIYH